MNAVLRYLHARYGKAALVDYWRELGRDYYRQRSERWREGGLDAVAADWREYFGKEPQEQVNLRNDTNTVELDIQVCPAIKHLRDKGREIVPYFCEHCDHVCGAISDAAGFSFERTGGMGACKQRFTATAARGEET